MDPEARDLRRHCLTRAEALGSFSGNWLIGPFLIRRDILFFFFFFYINSLDAIEQLSEDSM